MADTEIPEAALPPEPPPAPEPEVEQQAPPAEVEQPEQPSPTIPLSELKAERQKRQAMERELKQTREQYEARFSELMERMAPPRQAQPAQAEAPPPSFETDPAGYLRWQQEQHAKQLQAVQGDVEGYKRQQQEQQRHQQAMHQLTSAAAAAEAEFSQEAPDYHDALQHLRQETFADVQAEAPWLTPQQVLAEINRRELNIAAQSLQAGRNPAEVAYALAKRRGYKRGAGQAPAVAPASALGNGSTPVLEAKRAATARSLSGAPGAASGRPRFEDLVKMDQGKFNETIKSKEDFRRMMGMG